MSGEEKEAPGPGVVVAGYRIVSSLGVGGSGTVFRAEKEGTGELVAIKVMNQEHQGDDAERQRFMREAEVVKKLAHPNVVALLDYGFSDDLPYLVFPLLSGHTLEQRISVRGAMDWATVGRLSVQVLSALEVAHGMGIAHRDIKPPNIFLCDSPDGEIVQILDFGTAKIVGDASTKTDVTRVGVLVGTPRYMSPEQVRGEPLTPAADVYAYGLVMAELLVGKSIVSGDTDFDIFVQQGSDRAHDIPDKILASPYANVIERAIAKPLDVRYRLASQMLADVRVIVDRLSQGNSGAGEADMEATQFIGIGPNGPEISEQSKKMRQAFNAIANKNAPPPRSAPKPPPPAPPPPSAEQPAERVVISTRPPPLTAAPPQQVPLAPPPQAWTPSAHTVPAPQPPQTQQQRSWSPQPQSWHNHGQQPQPAQPQPAYAQHQQQAYYAQQAAMRQAAMQQQAPQPPSMHGHAMHAPQPALAPQPAQQLQPPPAQQLQPPSAQQLQPAPAAPPPALAVVAPAPGKGRLIAVLAALFVIAAAAAVVASYLVRR